MASWTAEQVLGLAPDDASAKAGQGLARPGKWSELGQAEGVAWGAIQGSGKEPYRCRIDLAEPAFKCSCPSRKFPCKHGLGLLLVLADHPRSVPAASPPDWVTEWLAQRAKRQETREAHTAEPRAVDAEAQAKRAAKRQARVEDGIEDLSLWLRDLVRQGLGVAQSQPLSFWEATAARLVDAQAPGLARRVRQLGELISSGEGWQGRVLAAIGRLHLLCEAYSRAATLPPELQADLRTAIGWNVPRDELLKLPRQSDTWCVLAQRVEREEQLRVQRTWLLGLETGQTALILAFAAGTQPFEQHFRAGAQFVADLVFYPAATPLRAMIVGERGEPIDPPRLLPAPPTLRDALRGYARGLAQQPWLEQWPLRAGGLTPVIDEVGRLSLVDEQGCRLPVVERFDGQWQTMAISGGAPIDVFGEWDGDLLRPLTVCAEGRVFTFLQSESGTILARVA